MKFANRLVLKPTVMLGAALSIFLSLFVGCAGISKVTKGSLLGTPQNSSALVSIPLLSNIKQVPRDTIAPAVRKETAPRKFDQKKAAEYLKSQYKLNYDELVSPDMNRLYQVIERQSTVINRLSTTIQQIRGRSNRRIDSLESQLRHYIQKAEKFQQIADGNELKRQNDSAQQQNDTAEQAKKINMIVNILLTGMIIIVLFLVALWVYVLYIWRTIKPVLYGK